MERREGAQTPYEVYCYQCQSTFAVGTRNCVHCGGRLASGEAPHDPSRGSEPGAVPNPEGTDESPVLSLARRMSGATLWLVFVLVAMLTRICQGDG